MLLVLIMRAQLLTTCCLSMLLVLLPAFGGEVDEVERLAPKYGGVVEYRLWDGTRVDLLTNTHAIEADWSYKWAEAIGQSLYYAAVTDKQPGIILLVKSYTQEASYIYRCQTVCKQRGITLWLEKVNP